MNTYTFNWSLAPNVPEEYAMSIPPFEGVVRDNTLTLATSADSADEASLREKADQLAHDIARSLGFCLRTRFDVAYGGYSVR